MSDFIKTGLRNAATGIAVCIVLLALPVSVSADNQVIMQNIGTSDPACMVAGGRMYLYCTEDAVGGGDLTIRTISVYSTADMYHWSARREALNESAVNWCTKAGNLWAPHTCYLGGSYHLYFPEISGSNFRIGHATCATPDGTFTPDANYMTAVTGNAIDPNVYLDTASGTAWLLWDIVWITPNYVYMQALNSTYNNVTGTMYNLSSGLGQSTGTYKEGPWLIKRGTYYYFYYADWTGPEQIGLSRSTTLTSGYAFQRYVMGVNSNSATIHPAVANFNGLEYLFWHCGGSEFGGSVVTGTKRVTGCEWTIIPNATTKTMRGVGIPGVRDTIQIDRRSAISGASISINGVGYMVSGIANNAWVRYDSVNFSGMTSVAARVANTNANNRIEIRLGSNTGTLLGTLTPPTTGSLTTWAVSPATNLTATATGKQNLCCVFLMGAASTMNVDWVSFGGTRVDEPDKAVPASSALSYQRLNKNIFTVANAAGAEVRLFNMKGQEMVNAFTSSGDRDLTVNLNGKSLPSGSYVLSVKSGKGSARVPFVY